MDIKTDSQDYRRIVRIKGNITFEHCPSFQSHLDSIIAEKDAREIVIDLIHVPFIDSSGVGEILRLFKLMREIDGEVVLMNPNKKLYDLFLMYRLDRFIRICEEKDLDIKDKQDNNPD